MLASLPDVMVRSINTSSHHVLLLGIVSQPAHHLQMLSESPMVGPGTVQRSAMSKAASIALLRDMVNVMRVPGRARLFIKFGIVEPEFIDIALEV